MSLCIHQEKTKMDKCWLFMYTRASVYVGRVISVTWSICRCQLYVVCSHPAVRSRCYTERFGKIQHAYKAAQSTKPGKKGVVSYANRSARAAMTFDVCSR